MWTRVRFALSRGLWQVARGVGTPAVSVPLAVLAAAFLAAEAAVRAGGGHWSLTDGWPWWALVWGALADAAIGALRALPFRQREDGRLERRPLGAAAIPGLLWRAAWLLAALGFLASSGFRDRMEFRVAEGEPFTAAPEQLVSRDPLRFGARGPFPVQLAVERVDGGAWAGGEPVRVVVRDQGGATRTIGRVLPAWFGWGRYLRVTAVGPTIQCEVAAPSGAGVRVAGKLDLYGPSPESEIRVEDVPFRVVVAPVASEPLARGRAPALAAAVHRGKLLVAEGQARDGAALEADGLRVSFPAWVPWAQLELVRDPGLPLAALGAVAALAALAVQVAARLRRGAAPAGRGDAP